MIDEIHSVTTAAARAKVDEKDIRDWINQGMRAMPVNRHAKRGPRKYAILDRDLVEWIEQRRESIEQKPIEEVKKIGFRQRAKASASAKLQLPWEMKK